MHQVMDWMKQKSEYLWSMLLIGFFSELLDVLKHFSPATNHNWRKKWKALPDGPTLFYVHVWSHISSFIVQLTSDQ
jgi:hypothetical protein